VIESLDAGPSLRAAPFGPGGKGVVQLLSPGQRTQIANIATPFHLPPRKMLYREGSTAQSVFIVAKGVVKTFRDLPSGKRRVMAFLYADDVFGLAQNGHYVNSVETITPVTCYRMRVAALTDLLRRDAELAVHFLCKVTHEWRRSLRHATILSRRDAVGRLTMFLRMLEQDAHLHRDSRIAIPMSRSDIGNYLGLSLESVSRALSRLERSRIVVFDGRHQVRVLDRPRFERIAAAL
jgi:CRP-like cAMP-binding protein